MMNSISFLVTATAQGFSTPTSLRFFLKERVYQEEILLLQEVNQFLPLVIPASINMWANSRLTEILESHFSDEVPHKNVQVSFDGVV